jgi:hypothetical protein
VVFGGYDGCVSGWGWVEERSSHGWKLELCIRMGRRCNNRRPKEQMLLLVTLRHAKKMGLDSV